MTIQCPNPACGSNQIALTQRKVAIRREGSRFPQVWYWALFWRLTGIVVLFFFAGVIVSWLIQAACLFLYFLGVSMTLGIGALILYVKLYASAPKVTLAQCRCQKCKYCWTQNNRLEIEPIRQWLESELAYCRSVKDKERPATKRYIAAVVSSLSCWYLRDGDAQQAVALSDEGLRLYRELNDQTGLALVTINACVMALQQGDYPKAEALGRESLTRVQELKNWQSNSYALNNLALALLYRDRSDADQALPLLVESLAFKIKMWDENGIGWALDGFAAVAQSRQQWDRAARLYGAAQAVHDVSPACSIPVEFPGYQRLVAEVRTQLGEVAYESAFAAGRAMSMEQAIESVADMKA